MTDGFLDSAQIRYQQERMGHWDRVSDRKKKSDRAGAYYHRLVKHYYRFLIPPGLRVLEVGCSHGDLLASLKPAFGVGIDFSSRMIQEARQKHPGLFFVQGEAHTIPLRGTFDVIILSDLVNDLWDVQRVFENLRDLCHQRSRVVLNFYNNLWRLPLSLARRTGLGANTLEQNWFAPGDVFNLLDLAAFEVIQRRACILLPLRLPFVSNLANRFLVNCVPFNWLALTNVVVARPTNLNRNGSAKELSTVSVIVPARNEAGNIRQIVERIPQLGAETEIIFVEGHSSDNTYETIQEVIQARPDKLCRVYRQGGRGKGDAVRLGFDRATGDILIILDADMTVPPEDLPRFVSAIAAGKGEFINGVRLVYPLENQSMRFFNILGNKFFSLAFSWLLGQPIKDTLCGTKVLRKRDYELIAKNRSYFGDFDPFGDFDLLFGAAKLNLKIAEMPIRYRSRTYGNTNIDRWKHGWLLLKMVVFTARRMKFI